MKIGPGIATFAALLVCIPLLSCASLSRGASDEDLVRGTVEQFCQGFNEKNANLVEEVLSDDFYGMRNSTKDQLVENLPRMFERLDDLEMDASEAQIEVDGSSATASPVRLQSSAFGVDLAIGLVKEGKQWLITGAERAD